MKPAIHLRAFAAVARCLLEADDVERMVLPALADADAERPHRSSAFNVLSIASQLVSIIALATWDRVASAAAASRWWPIFGATLAGAAGAVGLQHASRGSLSHAQLVFVLVGLAAAVVVVLAPSRLARTLLVAAVAAAVAGLTTVPWIGHAHEGVHRWLRLGPLAVHVSFLALPVFAFVVASLADRWPRPAVAAIVLSTLALLLAQPDTPAAVIYAATAIAAGWRSRSRAWVGCASAGGAGVALMLHSPLQPMEHVEGAHRLLAAQGPAWLAIGLGGVALVIVLAASSWREQARHLTTQTRVFERRTAGATGGLAGMLLVPLLLDDGGLPWISFGGSAVFAAYVLTAMVVRSDREARRYRTLTAG